MPPATSLSVASSIRSVNASSTFIESTMILMVFLTSMPSPSHDDTSHDTQAIHHNRLPLCIFMRSCVASVSFTKRLGFRTANVILRSGMYQSRPDFIRSRRAVHRFDNAVYNDDLSSEFDVCHSSDQGDFDMYPTMDADPVKTWKVYLPYVFLLLILGMTAIIFTVIVMYT